MNDMLKLVGIIFFAIVLIYIILILFKAQFKMVEGMTNEDGTSKSISGIAGGSTNYSEAIKSLVVKLQDELLVSKYRKDYENAIIHLDDLAGLMMIKTALSMKVTNDPKETINQFNNLNIIREAKDSLNSAMKFLDSQ